MESQSTTTRLASQALKVGLSALCAAVLSACVNYAGIHGDSQMAAPQQYATTQSLPAQDGHWPSADWADQIGRASCRERVFLSV